MSEEHFYYKKTCAKDLKVGDRVIRLEDGVQAGERAVLGVNETTHGNIEIRWSIASSQTFLPASPFFVRVNVVSMCDEAKSFGKEDLDDLEEMRGEK